MISRWTVLGFLAFVVCSGCGDDRSVPEGRGLEPRVGAGPVAPGAPEPAAEAAPAAPDPFAPPTVATGRGARRSAGTDPGALSSGRAAPGAVAAAPELATEQPPQAPRRDLNGELRARFGDPSTCFSSPDALPDRLSVSVEAVVSISGRVTRATVQPSAALPDADVACLRDRAGRVQLPALDDGPRTATATLEVQRRRPEPSGGPTP